jgi:hypothetical protein
MTPARPQPTRALALLMALCAATGAAQAGKASKPLNDTGATQCIVNNAFTKECTGTGQDGEFGRDVTKKNKDDGKAGFAYAKVCNSGELAGSGACPADPALGAGANEWACTQDKLTKLIWEVKTKDGGLRDWLKVYTNWGDGRTGDTSEFVKEVNKKGLCGASDWKLPTVAQLQGLVHLGVAYPGPTIDKNWFPHTTGGNTAPSYGVYWTADAYAGDASYAWVVHFGDGVVDVNSRDYGGAARLVRAGQ